jgi:pimeloyl-ACP methyl ester carboxylesterase
LRSPGQGIAREGLRDIVLLGFSYGGMVVTGALDQFGERVRHLVYLDAFVPAGGQPAYDRLRVPVPPGVAREHEDPEEAAWADPAAPRNRWPP